MIFKGEQGQLEINITQICYKENIFDLLHVWLKFSVFTAIQEIKHYIVVQHFVFVFIPLNNVFIFLKSIPIPMYHQISVLYFLSSVIILLTKLIFCTCLVVYIIYTELVPWDVSFFDKQWLFISGALINMLLHQFFQFIF